MRIDGALTPPGLIAHAKMHTLVYREGKLYILFTGKGPARRADWSKALSGQRLHRKMLENLAIGALMKSYMKTVLANEERIADDNLDEHSREKNSFCFAKADIADVSYKVTPVDIRLTFKGGGKKLKFDLGLENKREVEELVARLLDRGDGFSREA